MNKLWKSGLALVGALAGLLAAAPARAEQIVLFDITYTHTNANDSHHSISGAALNQPNNWTAPIDYSKGTIHFYQEVMSKPSNKPTIIDFCLISARDYGCIETFIYTNVGLHETVRSMAGGEVDKRNVIDFTQKMRSIQMVLKTPAPTWINGGRPQSDYLPSMMRFVATLVSPGGTYVRPKPTPGFNPADGGVNASPSDGGAAPDVGTPVTPPAPADGGGVVVDAPGPAVDAGGGSTPPTPPTTDPPPGPKLDAATSPPPPTSNPRPPSGSGGSGGGSGTPSTPTKGGAAGGCSLGGTPGAAMPLFGLLLGTAAIGLVTRRRRR